MHGVVEAGTQFMCLKLFPSCSPAAISHFPPLHLTCSPCSADWLHSPAAHLQQSSWLARVLLHNSHSYHNALCLHARFSSASHLHVSLLCRCCLPLSSATRLSPGKTRQDSFCPRPWVLLRCLRFWSAPGRGVLSCWVHRHKQAEKVPCFSLGVQLTAIYRAVPSESHDWILSALITDKPKNILINQVSNPPWENIMENN